MAERWRIYVAERIVILADGGRVADTCTQVTLEVKNAFIECLMDGGKVVDRHCMTTVALFNLSLRCENEEKK
jgi:hypothetical protein